MNPTNPIESPTDFIPISVVKQKYLPELTERWITELCRRGTFPSAKKPGTGGRTSQWRVLRSEVVAHVLKGRTQILAQSGH